MIRKRKYVKHRFGWSLQIKYEYIDKERMEMFYSKYDTIIAQIIRMIDDADKWLIR